MSSWLFLLLSNYLTLLTRLRDNNTNLNIIIISIVIPFIKIIQWVVSNLPQFKFNQIYIPGLYYLICSHEIGYLKQVREPHQVDSFYETSWYLSCLVSESLFFLERSTVVSYFSCSGLNRMVPYIMCSGTLWTRGGLKLHGDATLKAISASVGLFL